MFIDVVTVDFVFLLVVNIVERLSRHNESFIVSTHCL